VVDKRSYYASNELFADLVLPLVSPEEFRGSRVADVGSGTGRVARMLANAGAAHVVAVEPSAAYVRLAENTADLGERITCVRGTGEDIPLGLDLDWVVSFGVIHHIPDPAPVMRRIYRALRPGGRFVAWLYGLEGNRLYLSLVTPLRKVTTRLSHDQLERVAGALDVPLRGYIRLCKSWPLPMRAYMVDHIGKLSDEWRRVTIYDQLNPAYAKYYSREDARSLFESAGFSDVRLHHRHGYSWLVVGTRRD
jgi:SAM-dependent methyltransferase